MKEFLIKNIIGDTYTLVDKENHEEKVSFEFYDLTSLPTEGSIIFLNEAVLKEGITLRYGPLDSSYGRVITDAYDKDLLVLKIENEKIYLKRFYG